MTRLLIFAALWLPMVISACCHPTRIDHPIPIHAPSCLTRPAPVVPEGVEPFSAAWAVVYTDEMAWIEEQVASCGDRAEAATGKPDPGPAWWTKQPTVSGHGD